MIHPRDLPQGQRQARYLHDFRDTPLERPAMLVMSRMVAQAVSAAVVLWVLICAGMVIA